MTNITHTIENKSIKAEIYNFKSWVDITDPETLRCSLQHLLDTTGYHVLNYIEHHFPNGGFTGLWLLAESHLAIHTFIEEGQSYIELSGCNKSMNEIFVKEFNTTFKENYITDKLHRNEV